MRTLFSRLRPSVATLRSWSAAVSMICCIRAISEANVAMRIARAHSRRPGRTFAQRPFQMGVDPPASMCTQSEINSLNAMFAEALEFRVVGPFTIDRRFIEFEITCMNNQSGRSCDPKSYRVGNVWQTRKGSTAKTPAKTGAGDSGSSSRSSTFPSSLASSSLTVISPIVSRVA